MSGFAIPQEAISPTFSDSLQINNNLSDLSNLNTARSNLGVVLSRSKLSTLNPTVANPVIFAHRGGSNLHPENTLEAWSAAIEEGAVAIEFDVQLLADGSLGIMHDATIDRTTTGTGNVTDQTAASWQNLVTDIGATLGGAYTSSTQKTPMFEDVVRLFGNKVLLVPEAKNTGSGVGITAMLQKYNIHPDSALVQSFDFNELTSAVTAGYNTIGLSDSAVPSDLVARGIGWVGVSTSASGAYISSMIAAGIKVAAYTPNWHYQRNTLAALGVIGYFSDDPIYLSKTGYLRTTDPYKAQTWYHGSMANPNAGAWASPLGRGGFTATEWGTNVPIGQLGSVNCGWASPIKSDPNARSYSITFTVRFQLSNNGATRWVGMFIGPDDTPYTDNSTVTENGYHCLMRKNGQMQIFRRVAGVVSALATSTGAADVAIPDNGTGQYKLTVTATTVKIERLDQPGSATATDNTFGAGYVQLTNSQLQAWFSSMTVA